MYMYKVWLVNNETNLKQILHKWNVPVCYPVQRNFHWKVLSNTAEPSRCQSIPWYNFLTEDGIFGVTFSIWAKDKLCKTGFCEYRMCPGISMFQLKIGGLKSLCAPMYCHGAKANCVFKIQVFFLDSFLRVLLKLWFTSLNDSVFSWEPSSFPHFHHFSQSVDSDVFHFHILSSLWKLLVTFKHVSC